MLESNPLTDELLDGVWQSNFPGFYEVWHATPDIPSSSSRKMIARVKTEIEKVVDFE